MSESVQECRRRLAERGFKRVEVAVSASDAALLRRLAKALASDGQQAERLRRVVDGTMPDRAPIKFEEWLVSD